MIKLSYILPCYKVEKYIRRCLNSIYSTSLALEEYEVLCFDDNAPDSTPQILDEYAAKYPNLHVVHSKVNIGPGGGRNRLLSIAKGEFIWFVDADDMIISDSVANILATARNNRLDVLTFNYREWDSNENVIPSSFALQDSPIDSGMQLANKVFSGGIVHYMGFPWRFLLRRSYLLEKNILFPEKRYPVQERK